MNLLATDRSTAARLDPSLAFAMVLDEQKELGVRLSGGGLGGLIAGIRALQTAYATGLTAAVDARNASSTSRNQLTEPGWVLAPNSLRNTLAASLVSSQKAVANRLSIEATAALDLATTAQAACSDPFPEAALGQEARDNAQLVLTALSSVDAGDSAAATTTLATARTGCDAALATAQTLLADLLDAASPDAARVTATQAVISALQSVSGTITAGQDLAAGITGGAAAIAAVRADATAALAAATSATTLAAAASTELSLANDVATAGNLARTALSQLSSGHDALATDSATTVAANVTTALAAAQALQARLQNDPTPDTTRLAAVAAVISAAEAVLAVATATSAAASTPLATAAGLTPSTYKLTAASPPTTYLSIWGTSGAVSITDGIGVGIVITPDGRVDPTPAAGAGWQFLTDATFVLPDGTKISYSPGTPATLLATRGDLSIEIGGLAAGQVATANSGNTAGRTLDAARNAEAVDILESAGKIVTPVFISFDPERDTPEVLRDFTDALHPRMIGLTGTPDQVKAASLAYKTYYQKQTDGDPQYYLMDHSTFSYLMLPDVGFVDFFDRNISAADMAAQVECFVDAAK